MDALIARLEVATTRLESLVASGPAGGASGAAGASAAGGDSAMVEAFDEILSGSLKAYLDLSHKIGGEVQQHAEIVERAFKAQRDFLVVVSKSKDPKDQGVLTDLLKPTSDAISQAVDFKDKNRKAAAVANHLATIAEGIPALGWVMVAPKPAPHVGQSKEAAEFYSNRVLKEFKDKDENQKNWAKSFPQILSELQEFVKKYHTTGLVWNNQGGDAKAAATSSASSAPSAAKPAPVAAPVAVAVAAPSSEAKGNLFAALNSDGLTKGLKKVSDDQKTHKNPALRAGAIVQEKESNTEDLTPKSAAAGKAADLPPKFALENNKWVVEYQKGNKNIVIDQTANNHVVYIYKCVNSVVIIKGKINQITLDGCKKTDIVCDSVISSIDAVNCQSCKAQIIGKAPTVNIDKTDGFQLYLSKDSLDTEILFAKSSELNVLAPGEKEDDDMHEAPLPEQSIAKWDGSKFVCKYVEHKG